MKFAKHGNGLVFPKLGSHTCQPPLSTGQPYVETRGYYYIFEERKVKKVKKTVSPAITSGTELLLKPESPEEEPKPTMDSQFDSLFDDREDQNGLTPQEQLDTEMVDKWIEAVNQCHREVADQDCKTTQTNSDRPGQQHGRNNLLSPNPHQPSSSHLKAHIRCQQSPLEQPHLQPYIPTDIKDFITSNQSSTQPIYIFNNSSPPQPTTSPLLLPSTILTTNPDTTIPKSTDLYILINPTTGETNPECPRPFPLPSVLFHGPAPTPHSTSQSSTQYITLFTNGTWSSHFRKITFRPGEIVECIDQFFDNDNDDTPNNQNEKIEWEVQSTWFETGGKEVVVVKQVKKDGDDEQIWDRKEVEELWNFRELFAERWGGGIPEDDNGDDGDKGLEIVGGGGGGGGKDGDIVMSEARERN